MSDLHDDGRSTVYESKLYLDPRDVIALASTIPNCSQVTPPTGQHLFTKTTLQSQRSTDSTSYFSQISCHLTETFSIEKDDEGHPEDEILSFLVSDTFSIEQLIAEAEGGNNIRRNELDGAGVARIDVYCQSGTVCTCRLIQTTTAVADASTLDRVCKIETPRKGNVTGITSNYQANTQFRRIIRQKCSLETLRSILTQPPKLPEINASVVDGSSSNGDEDNSQYSTVSKKMRIRRKNRLADKFAFLSPEQQKFLKQHQKMYEKRLRCDEKARQNVANAILAGGMVGNDTEIELASLESLSLNDAVESTPTTETTETNDIIGPFHARQQMIQEKLEVADVGLAILMAEAQRLKRILKEMEELEKGEEDDSYTNLGTDTDRSRSTFQSTDHDDDGNLSVMSNDSDMQTLQGCEVEYSFSQKYHDVLEGALMGKNVEDDSSFSEDDSLMELSTAKNAMKCRGRSPPRGKGVAKPNLSPIVAIPTNGHGCIVLRQDGSFDVVGKIPDVLRRKLFRRNGPLPDQISLGTK